MAKDGDKRAFRRQAALAILPAYVSRHGGFQPEARDGILAAIWEMADAFVDMEGAAPPGPPAPAPEARQPARRAHPGDEWGVRDGDDLRREFVSRGEAEEYAACRPGALVVQLAGPEVESAVTTAD